MEVSISPESSQGMVVEAPIPAWASIDAAGAGAKSSSMLLQTTSSAWNKHRRTRGGSRLHSTATGRRRAEEPH